MRTVFRTRRLTGSPALAARGTGNIGTPERFAVTLLRPAPTCTTTVTGVRNDPLVVRSGVTCLEGATVNGPVSIDGTTGAAVLVGSTVTGSVSMVGARTAEPVVLAGITVGGPLACSANSATPTNLQAPNHVSGPRSGHCAKL